MGCDNITIRTGKKIVVIPFSFVPATTTFASGDAIQISPFEAKDAFDIENGKATVLEYRVQHSHGTPTLVKKGISAYLFSQKPASMSVAIDAAEDISVADSKFLLGRLAVATADYADVGFGTPKVTAAVKEYNLPVWNDSTATGEKKSLWIKLVADESITFAASGQMDIDIVLECH